MFKIYRCCSRYAPVITFNCFLFFISFQKKCLKTVKPMLDALCATYVCLFATKQLILWKTISFVTHTPSTGPCLLKNQVGTRCYEGDKYSSTNSESQIEKKCITNQNSWYSRRNIPIRRATLAYFRLLELIISQLGTYQNRNVTCHFVFKSHWEQKIKLSDRYLTKWRTYILFIPTCNYKVILSQ